MEKITPKTLSGFMELLPKEQILFNKVTEIIKSNYEKFGFLPLDTPIIESSDVLLAKAGGDTEKQIYSVINGDLKEEKSKLSMRFDLTVPLAKYVTLYYPQLTFPFRRYQIGKVYRGERAQKGRFREFYQADIDIIGNEELSLINDAEIPSIIYNIFKELAFGEFVININNRKIMKGLFESLLLQEKSADILRTIDKLEKIGKEKIEIILKDDFNLSTKDIDFILNFANMSGTSAEKLQNLKNLNIENETYKTGVNELESVVENMRKLGVPEKNFNINLTITRGLDYYTGTVYETFLTAHKNLGSICSGGRYDNLADYYTNKKLPGVGISIGLTRLFDQILENNLLAEEKNSITKVLIVPMIENYEVCLNLASTLRKANINTEIYLEQTKFKNKLSYANKLDIPYVIIVGEDEVSGGYYTFKNMQTSEQQQLTLSQILDIFNK